MQKLFDHIARHLLTQAERAAVRLRTGESLCRYRIVKEDGTVLKCAAGAVIADDKYHKSVEGRSSRSIPPTLCLPELREELVGHGEDRGYDLLGELQGLHDYTPLANWPHLLCEAARTRALKYDVVTGLEVAFHNKRLMLEARS